MYRCHNESSSARLPARDAHPSPTLLLLIRKPTQIPEHVANDGNGSGGGATAIIAPPAHSVGKNRRSRSSTWEEYLMTTYITTENPEERHIFLIRKCTTRCSAAESLPSRPLFTSSPCFNKGFSRVWENNLLRGGRERKGPSTTMTTAEWESNDRDQPGRRRRGSSALHPVSQTFSFSCIY